MTPRLPSLDPFQPLQQGWEHSVAPCSPSHLCWLVQLTFKGDCKALSIYSGILLQGGAGHCLSPEFPPAATSVDELLINSPDFWSSGMSPKDPAESPETLVGTSTQEKSCSLGTQVLPASCG